MTKRTGFLASLLAAISYSGNGTVDQAIAAKPSWRDNPIRPYQEGDPLFTRPTGHHQETGIRNPRTTKRQRRQERIDEARTMVDCWRQARNERRRGEKPSVDMIAGTWGGGTLQRLNRAVAVAERDYDRARGVRR